MAMAHQRPLVVVADLVLWRSGFLVLAHWLQRRAFAWPRQWIVAAGIICRADSGGDDFRLIFAQQSGIAALIGFFAQKLIEFCRRDGLIPDGRRCSACNSLFTQRHRYHAVLALLPILLVFWHSTRSNAPRAPAAA